ncbi:unnamed protein product [Vitrella brassicaformis CCMP3155]|uniref:Uncharacterized protein n=1 Tax=Vitrella brassicaformis (strain CCMP3155) TaxID=1169540 RepID=A0A0G4F8L3_VITBC|nr:unnamed protein product [Vitrella brassicaformis CCMP3155]|eukprot:CEM09041.1 unnamed protein product [Vitrella brassicaformis CCMP3155]
MAASPISGIPSSLHPLLADLLDTDDALTLRLVKTDFIVATEHPIDGAYFTSRLSKAIDTHMNLGAELLRVAAIEGPHHRRSRSDGAAWLSVSDELPRVLRRLFVLEHGGEWVRWRPHLVVMRLLRGEPLVLGEASFDHVSRRAGRQSFLTAPEAMRQLSVIGREAVVDGQRLLEGNDRLADFTSSGFHPFQLRTIPYAPFLDAFDPHNPSARYPQFRVTFRSLSCMVGDCLLRADERLRSRCKTWRSLLSESSCYRRCVALLTESPAGPVEGCHVFDAKTETEPTWHSRYVLLADTEVAAVVVVYLELNDGRRVYGSVGIQVHTTEECPYTRTRGAVMGVCGGELGSKVWSEENEEPGAESDSDSDDESGGQTEHG